MNYKQIFKYMYILIEFLF